MDYKGYSWRVGLNTGSPKKHETWKTPWELFTDILIRMKGPTIKPIMKQGKCV